MSAIKLACVLLVSLAACGDDDADPTDAGANDGAQSDRASNDGSPRSRAWTVFVYGHGDHNLSPSLAADIVEMSNATLTDEVQIVVMADWDGSAGEPFTTGTDWYRIGGSGAEPIALRQEPEKDLDDPAVIRDSIAAAFTEFPAERYGLVMWDHGGAWLGGFGGDTQDGTVHEPGILPPALADAIGDGLEQAGLDGERPLDFLAFDTCLMAGAEVVFELSPLSEIYIANAEIDYGAGWDYTATFSWLAAHPDATARDFATAEANHWDAHHASMGVSDELLRSHVAIDTAAFEAYLPMLEDFDEAWVGSTGMADLAIGRSVHFSLPGYYQSGVGDLSNEPHLRDLGQFLARVSAGSSDTAVAAAASAALAGLDSFIVTEKHGSLRNAQAGLHIALPGASTLDALVPFYRMTAPGFVEATGWDGTLGVIARIADDVAPEVATTIVNAMGTSAALPQIHFRSDDPDVATVDVLMARRDPSDSSRIQILGTIGSGVVAAGEEYQYEWTGALVGLGSGAATQVVATFPFARNDDGGTTGLVEAQLFAIPGRVGLMGEVVEAALIVSGDADVADLVVIETGEDTTASVTLTELREYAPDTAFTPVIPVIPDGSTEAQLVEGTPIAIPASGTLALGAVAAPAGNYALLVHVTDVWGNAEPVGGAVMLAEEIFRP